MARARNIKPGFFTNELLGTYDPIVTLLFAGLWCLADKEGILEDRPLRIKAELFPYRDSLDINGYLTVLERDGFLTRYEADGKRYIMIENFAKHQTPHHTEKPRGYPKPTQETRGLQCERVLTPLNNRDSKVPSRSDLLIPDSLIPDSTTTSSPSQAKDDTLQCPVEKIIEAYHELMPDNPRCKVLNQARRSAIKARWLEASRLTCKPFGYATREGGLAAWRSFFETCAESPFLTGKAKPTPGKPTFFADVDFLFSPGGFAKCLENKYHREAA